MPRETSPRFSLPAKPCPQFPLRQMDVEMARRLKPLARFPRCAPSSPVSSCEFFHVRFFTTRARLAIFSACFFSCNFFTRDFCSASYACDFFEATLCARSTLFCATLFVRDQLCAPSLPGGVGGGSRENHKVSLSSPPLRQALKKSVLILIVYLHIWLTCGKRIRIPSSIVPA